MGIGSVGFYDLKVRDRGCHWGGYLFDAWARGARRVGAGSGFLHTAQPCWCFSGASDQLLVRASQGGAVGPSLDT